MTTRPVDLVVLIYPADTWVDTPSHLSPCDSDSTFSHMTTLKRLIVMANRTHTWWYNRGPLNREVLLATGWTGCPAAFCSDYKIVEA